jgi:hypothetical protein
MTQAEREWVISLSDLSHHLEYYTPTELAGLLERYEYELREFWERAVKMLQVELGDRVFGYIVDFTYDGEIDRIAAVIVDCERREIKLVDLERWARQRGLEQDG